MVISCSYTAVRLSLAAALVLPALLTGFAVPAALADDVTPAPYNQPPCPPSGDTATSACTVTGIAP